MDKKGKEAIQTFQVKNLGIVLGLIFPCLTGYGFFIDFRDKYFLVQSSFQSGTLIDILWPVGGSIIWSLFWLLFCLITEWFLLSLILLNIEVTRSELRFTSSLPVFPNIIMFRHKRSFNARYLSVSWSKIREINYDKLPLFFRWHPILRIHYGFRIPIAVYLPEVFYPLRNLFSAINLHVPLHKFNKGAQKFFVKLKNRRG